MMNVYDIAFISIVYVISACFCWCLQFGAGVEYGISEQLFLDLRYRYFASSDIGLEMGRNETIDMEFASHNIYAGLRYQF